jgi:hypothetical protein
MSTPSRPNATADQPVAAAGARAQLLFRALNEEIRRLTESFALDGALDLVCECRDGDCFERVSISRDEYESVRQFATRFLISTEHAGPNERVVQAGSTYAVVEMVDFTPETTIVIDTRGSRGW